MFFEPAPSQADIHFRILGFPVRIHPFFWLVTLVLGMQGTAEPKSVLIWVIAVTVSILIHELGHAVWQRRFGGHPRIVLHGVGGLAICDDCDRSSWTQIVISLAGPCAGFLFAVVVLLGIALVGHGIALLLGDHFQLKLGAIEDPTGLPLLGMTFLWERFSSMHLNLMLQDLLWINVLWGVVNLLPIYPLDGGRIARELCLRGDVRGGIELSLQISVGAALAMAAVGLFAWRSLFTVLFFGYLAYSSYQTLHSYRSNRW